jgi:antitoxin FitA
MPSIQIKNVPDDVRATLRARAANLGQSLQEYLLGRLTAEARQPSLDEILDRAAHRSGGALPLHTAADQLRAERDAK